jgi:hypothetical protein
MLTVLWRTLSMCSRPLTGGFATGSYFQYTKNENALGGVNRYSTRISTCAPTGTPAFAHIQGAAEEWPSWVVNPSICLNLVGSIGP